MISAIVLFFVFLFHANIQRSRLLVSSRAYQSIKSIFFSQQTNSSRIYQLRNQPSNMPINSTLALFGTLDQAIAEKAGNMNKPMPICCEFIVMHLLFLGPTIVYW